MQRNDIDRGGAGVANVHGYTVAARKGETSFTVTQVSDHGAVHITCDDDDLTARRSTGSESFKVDATSAASHCGVLSAIWRY